MIEWEVGKFQTLIIIFHTPKQDSRAKQTYMHVSTCTTCIRCHGAIFEPNTRVLYTTYIVSRETPSANDANMFIASYLKHANNII